METGNDLNVKMNGGKSIHNFLSGVQLPVFYLNKVTISLCIIKVKAHGKNVIVSVGVVHPVRDSVNMLKYCQHTTTNEM